MVLYFVSSSRRELVMNVLESAGCIVEPTYDVKKVWFQGTREQWQEALHILLQLDVKIFFEESRLPH